jgi:quercetin dioxygenase-like cupin family protein
LKRVEAYEDWRQAEGVPLVTGFYIEDMNEVEVAPWARKGVNGAIVNLEGTGGVNDTHVVEVPPGKSTNPERHMYEEMIYVLSGRGATTVWYDEKQKQTFEWGTGAVFAVPLNAWSQHHNGSGADSMRFMTVTNLPTILNTFHNEEFVFDNPFVFNDRFTGENGYFDGSGKMHKKRIWETNFVPDVRSTRLYSWVERGAGGTNIFLELAQNSMGAHISQFPVGTYKKGHRHGPGAHVIILGGHGFSLLWKEGEERVKADWKPGSLVVPPEHWFHEHFNSGTEPARYLALRFTGRTFLQPGSYSGAEGADVSVKDGGWQIEYEDEDEEVHRLFEAELAEHGATCRMKKMVPWCTGVEGPAVAGAD